MTYSHIYTFPVPRRGICGGGQRGEEWRQHTDDTDDGMLDIKTMDAKDDVAIGIEQDIVVLCVYVYYVDVRVTVITLCLMDLLNGVSSDSPIIFMPLCNCLEKPWRSQASPRSLGPGLHPFAPGPPTSSSSPGCACPPQRTGGTTGVV